MYVSLYRGLGGVAGCLLAGPAEIVGQARVLGDHPGIDVVPDPPQTPLLHLHLRGDRDALRERALALARTRRVWLFHELAPTAVPGVHRLELNVGLPALAIPAAEAGELFTALLAP